MSFSAARISISKSTQKDGPPPRGIGGGPFQTCPRSPVEPDHVGLRRDRDARTRRRGRGRECEDGASHERADRANREDGWCDDVSPNAHDCLHALTEVICLDPGIGGPFERLCPFFLFASLWLLHKLG